MTRPTISAARIRSTAKASGFFLLRTPLLPVEEFESWRSEVLSGSGRDYLRSLIRRPAFSHALLLASPSSHEELSQRTGDRKGDKNERILNTVARYYSRMIGRATPFGLFAGFSHGSFGQTSNLQLAALADYECHIRLDHDYIDRVIMLVTSLPSFRAGVRWAPNDSLYESGANLRYVEGRVGGGGRSYALVNVARTEYLSRTLARASAGARIAELTAGLVADDPDLDVTEAEAFVGDLIDSQILIADLTPPITGPNDLQPLLGAMAASPSTAAYSLALERAHVALAGLRRANLGAAVPDYAGIAEGLSHIPIQTSIARLFQLDLSKPLTGTLSVSLVDRLLEGIECLRRVAPPKVDVFRAFRERFVERYERSVVPLSEVLDEESGIGFDRLEQDDQPLIEGLPFDDRPVPSAPPTGREAWILPKLVTCLASGTTVMALTEADFEALGPSHETVLPDAFAATCLLGQNAAGDEYIVMRTVSGPSGARMLGRFCAADPHLTNRVADHMRAEESLCSEAIYAEIVHQPTGRLGNIQARPRLRSAEIPILAPSSAPPESQFPLSDLSVTVVGERVVLLSTRLGKEILPRLSTAHSYQRGLTVYRFLASLQAQGCAEGLFWNWGSLRSLAFLPRVTFHTTVLARAQWRLEPTDLANLRSKKPHDRSEAIDGWRESLKLPRWILLSEGDNELPVDLTNPESVEMFLDAAPSNKPCTVLEMLPPPEDAAVQGPEGRFVAELIVPFTRPEVRRSRASVAIHPRTNRVFGPDSEWCYLKLYCGPATADRLLVDEIGPLVERLETDGAIDRWFYIRYSDPQWHLRVRFHGSSGVRERVMDAVRQQLPDHLGARIWRVQLDTYHREVERYGGPDAIDVAEHLFHHDSRASLELLRLLVHHPAGIRWRHCIVSFDWMVEDLGFKAHDKEPLLTYLRNSVGRQFQTNRRLTKSLAARFRLERKRLENLVDESRLQTSVLGDILRRRSAAMVSPIASLRRLQSTSTLTVAMPDLTSSFLHMSANRLLRSSSSRQEFVMYDFLNQLCRSRSARQRAHATSDQQRGQSD